MDCSQLVRVMAAMAHPTRIAIIRHLGNHTPGSISVGALVHALKVPQSTLSAHVSILVDARLLVSDRRSRAIFYRVNSLAIAEALAFILSEICKVDNQMSALIRSVLRADTAAASPRKGDPIEGLASHRRD